MRERLDEKVAFNVWNLEWDYVSIVALKYTIQKRIFRNPLLSGIFYIL